jgi:hypothetical protein
MRYIANLDRFRSRVRRRLVFTATRDETGERYVVRMTGNPQHDTHREGSREDRADLLWRFQYGAGHDGRVMAEETRSEGRTVRIVVLALGLLLALAAALLLFLDAIESGWAIVILIIGIGLMTTSGLTARGF